MRRCEDRVRFPTLFHQVLKGFITEVGATSLMIVLGTPNLGNMCSFNNLTIVLLTIGFASYFYTFIHIIDGDKNIQVSTKRLERTHEVDSPTIEYLDSESQHQQHVILWVNAPKIWHASYRLIGFVSKHSRPLTPMLKYFGNRHFRQNVPPTHLWMTKCYSILVLVIRYTTPNNLI